MWWMGFIYIKYTNMGGIEKRMFERYCYDGDVVVKDYLDTESMERITHIWDRKTGKELNMDEKEKWDLSTDVYLNWSKATEEEVDKMVKWLKKKD